MRKSISKFKWVIVWIVFHVRTSNCFIYNVLFLFCLIPILTQILLNWGFWYLVYYCSYFWIRTIFLILVILAIQSVYPTDRMHSCCKLQLHMNVLVHNLTSVKFNRTNCYNFIFIVIFDIPKSKLHVFLYYLYNIYRNKKLENNGYHSR